MPIALQLFLTIVICVAISIIVFSAIFIALFSPGFWGPFGPPSSSLSWSLWRGATFGVIHGLITGLLFCWRRPESVGGSIWTTIIGTEVFLILAVVAFYLYLSPHPVNHNLLSNSYRFEDIHRSIFFIVGYHIIFSIVLLIPSVFIGIMNSYVFKILIFRG